MLYCKRIYHGEQGLPLFSDLTNSIFFLVLTFSTSSLFLLVYLYSLISPFPPTFHHQQVFHNITFLLSLLQEIHYINLILFYNDVRHGLLSRLRWLTNKSKARTNSSSLVIRREICRDVFWRKHKRQKESSIHHSSSSG